MTETNTPRLETRWLILRRLGPEDVQGLYEIFSDPKVYKFVPVKIDSPEAAREFYRENYEKIYSEPKGCAYGLFLKEGGTLIGYMNVPMDEPYDFGYGIRPEYWGRGFASEAARAVIPWLRELGLPYITATHDRENPRSGWVMRAVGMSYRYTYHEYWQAGERWVWFRMYQLNLNGRHETYEGYRQRFPEHMVEEDI